MVQRQDVFQRLKKQIMPLEDWYDEQMRLSKEQRIPSTKLAKAHKELWSSPDLSVMKLFIFNPVTRELPPRHFIPYIDAFFCHFDSQYFHLLAHLIAHQPKIFLPRWSAWINARSDILFAQEENQTQKVFKSIFEIQ